MHNWHSITIFITIIIVFHFFSEELEIDDITVSRKFKDLVVRPILKVRAINLQVTVHSCRLPHVNAQCFLVCLFVCRVEATRAKGLDPNSQNLGFLL